MRDQQGQNRWVHADELADLLRWCAALSTNPADLAGAVLLAAGQRWSALVDSPADLRELTVTTFLETGQPLDPAVETVWNGCPKSFVLSSPPTTSCRSSSVPC